MIWLTTEDEKFAEEFYKENKLDPEKTIALFTGVQQNTRFYEHYGKVIKDALKDKRFTLIALGATEDNFINQVNLDASGMHSINLSGKLTLRQSAAIIKKCSLAVGAETGLAHIACAVGTPNVILLGGGQFGRFMPYSSLSSVVCLPLECYKCDWYCKYQRVYCVREILPEVFVEAIRQTLYSKYDKPRVFVQGKSLWNPKSGEPRWEWFDKFLDIESIEIIPIGEVPEMPQKRVVKKKTLELLPSLLNDQAISKDKHGAKETLLDLIKTHPSYYPAYNNLACLYWDEGDFENAEKYFEEALKVISEQLIVNSKQGAGSNEQEIIEGYRSVVIGYGEMLMRLKRFKKAKEIFEGYLKNNQDDEEIRKMFSRCEGLLEKVNRLNRIINKLGNR